MIEAITGIALVSGIAAVGAPTLTAMMNISRLMRTSGNHLVVTVDGKDFILDMGSIESIDVRSIDSATRAVEKKAEVTA